MEKLCDLVDERQEGDTELTFSTNGLPLKALMDSASHRRFQNTGASSIAVVVSEARPITAADLLVLGKYRALRRIALSESYASPSSLPLTVVANSLGNVLPCLESITINSSRVIFGQERTSKEVVRLACGYAGASERLRLFSFNYERPPGDYDLVAADASAIASLGQLEHLELSVANFDPVFFDLRKNPKLHTFRLKTDRCLSSGIASKLPGSLTSLELSCSMSVRINDQSPDQQPRPQPQDIISAVLLSDAFELESFAFNAQISFALNFFIRPDIRGRVAQLRELHLTQADIFSRTETGIRLPADDMPALEVLHARFLVFYAAEVLGLPRLRFLCADKLITTMPPPPLPTRLATSAPLEELELRDVRSVYLRHDIGVAPALLARMAEMELPRIRGLSLPCPLGAGSESESEDEDAVEEDAAEHAAARAVARAANEAPDGSFRLVAQLIGRCAGTLESLAFTRMRGAGFEEALPDALPACKTLRLPASKETIRLLSRCALPKLTSLQLVLCNSFMLRDLGQSDLAWATHLPRLKSLTLENVMFARDGRSGQHEVIYQIERMFSGTGIMFAHDMC